MNKKTMVFSIFSDANLTQTMVNQGNYEKGSLLCHTFPDEETLITIESDVKDRELIFIASLDRPNTKIMPLLLAAETAKTLGAKKITLIAPYLAYMRQDKVFEPGQGITSQYFANLLSHYFDGLITIDPHLHRWHSLKRLYSIPCLALHASKPIAQWILKHVDNPILIGPDIESQQWVEDIAHLCAAQSLILQKVRRGDKTVEISIPNLEQYPQKTPILIDDIISTGTTMIQACRHLQALKTPPPICIAVHPVFAGDAYQNLLKAGLDKIITCNTIPHISNGIDISGIIIDSFEK